jgi:hypothetical protein
LKFLGRARRFFQELASEPDSKVQYFNVTCASGHRVRGERTEGYQALRCPACGEGVFVLPRSPLPEPGAPAQRPGAARANQGGPWVDEGPVELTDPGRVALSVGDDKPGSAEAEIIWDDPAPEPAHRAGRKSARAQKAGPAPADDNEPFWEEDLTRAAAARATEPSDRRRKRPDPESRSATADAPAAREKTPAGTQSARRGRPRAAPEPAALEIPSRRRTPKSLTAILIVVPLLVVTAVAWRYWRHKRAEYPLIAERGKTEGIPALEEGKFDKAFQLLSAAKSAVDALGGEGEEADDIRIAAQEAAIFVDQSPRTLEEMLDEAGRTEHELWKSRFETHYKGRGILIETTINEEPGAGPQSRYLVEYVILPNGSGNNFNDTRVMAPDKFGLIDFNGFELFNLAHPRKGDHVTIGARLASFAIDDKKEVWLVGLEPKSGVFIKHTKALEAMGWPRGAQADLPPEDQP